MQILQENNGGIGQIAAKSKEVLSKRHLAFLQKGIVSCKKFGQKFNFANKKN